MASGMKKGCRYPFVITPPWWRTNWFRALSAAVFLAMLWAVYQFRVRQLQQEFNMRLEGRVEERTRIARDLHDTLLQSFQGLIPVFQTARNLLPGQSDRAAEVLDDGLHEAVDAIVEGRNAIQNLRAKPSLDCDLVSLLNAAGLGTGDTHQRRRGVRPHSAWSWRDRGSRSLRSSRTRFIGSAAKCCAMPSGTRTRAGSRQKSGTTATCSG